MLRYLVVVIVLFSTTCWCWTRSSWRQPHRQPHQQSHRQPHRQSHRQPHAASMWMTSTMDPTKVSSAVKFSGSNGAALEVSSVCISIGNNDVMSDVNWTILPKERWGLVGPNGVGKSTFLKAITGTGGELVSIREGEVLIAKKARMGYLEQKGVSGSTNTVRKEVSSRMDRLAAAIKGMEHAEKVVSEGVTSEDALKALEEASIEFEAAGGYTSEQKIANVLKGLGFIEDDYDRSVSEFSGGWQMRIALARLLLSEPDLLLLDEPTNHLDKAARSWLGEYLSQYDGTLLVVSHDVELLETAVNSIAEVRGGTVELYKSRNHAQWIVEREERVRAAQSAYEANQKEIARLQSYVDRFGAKTMGATLAQSRLKTIEKLEDSMPDGNPSLKIKEGPKPFLKLPTPPRGSQQLLELKGCTLAWPMKQLPSQTLDSSMSDTIPTIPTETPAILTDVNLIINRGSRIVVRGPNGAGKSTLLSALSGKLVPALGDRIEGDGLALGVFTQDLAQDLDQQAIAVDVVTNKVRQLDPTISDEKARSALGALGLTGEKSLRKVGYLSGGEKARVALASFVLIPNNLLLLDEPSNHLDSATLEVLTKALRDFTGTTMVISHDRQFLEQLQPTHVITVRGGKVDLQERGLREEDWDCPIDSRDQEYTQKFAADNSNHAQTLANFAELAASNGGSKTKKGTNTVASKDSPVVASPPVVITDEKELKKIKANAARRITKIESSLAKYDEEMAVIDENMLANGRDRGKLYDLQKDKDVLQAKIDKLYVEYEEQINLL